MTTSTATPLQIPQPLAWITGIAVILSFVAGIALLMGWIPDSAGGVSDRPQDSGTGKPLLKSTPSAAATAIAVPLIPPAVALCTRCGVIVSMQDIVTGGEGSGLAVAGGAVAGNAVEKRASTAQSREITVLLDDGSIRAIRVTDNMAWDTGDHVKIVDGVLLRN